MCEVELLLVHIFSPVRSFSLSVRNRFDITSPYGVIRTGKTGPYSVIQTGKTGPYRIIRTGVASCLDYLIKELLTG